MEEVLLDETEFDVIVLGTGIAESMVSASLAAQGKTVLHLDSNGYYGTNNTTLSLSALEDLGALGTESGEVAVASGCLAAYAGVPALSDFTLDLFQPQSIHDSTEDESHASEEKEGEAKVPDEEGATKNDSVNESSASGNDKGQESNTDAEPETEEVESDVDERTREEKLHDELLAASRSFNIDLYPTGILSNGRAVELLVNSHVHHYLEFKCFENSYITTPDGLQQVPCSKTAVFKSSFISLSEKRQLMRFVTAHVQSEPENQADLDDKPLVELLQSRRMSQKLIDIILYAIVQVDSDQTVPQNQIKTKDGLGRMKKYMTSLGKYGETPLLYSLFGCSEIAQAFSRSSAVKGTIFVLRRGAKHFTLDEATGDVTGVVCTAGQTLTAKHIVCSKNYVAPRLSLKPSHSRAVIVTDKSLVDGGKHLVITVPGKVPVTAHQLDSTLSTVPKDKFLVQLVAKASGAGAKADLHEAVRQLFQVEDGQDTTKPAALYQAYFHLARYQSDSTDIPANLHVCGEVPELGIELDFASVVAEAEVIFHRICGDDVEFFAKTPDPLREVPEKDAEDELIEYAEAIDKKAEGTGDDDGTEEEVTLKESREGSETSEKSVAPALRVPPAAREKGSSESTVSEDED